MRLIEMWRKNNQENAKNVEKKPTYGYILTGDSKEGDDWGASYPIGVTTKENAIKIGTAVFRQNGFPGRI